MSQDKKMAVVVVCLDGGRRDLIYKEALEGRAPNFLAMGVRREHASCDVTPVLTQSGPHTGGECYWMTSPGWSSTFSGVDNNKHKVGHNDVKMVKKFWETSKKYPTFLEVAHKAKLKTMAVGRPNVVGVNPDKKGYRKQSEIAVLDGNYKRGLIDFYQGRRVAEGVRGTRANRAYFLKHLDQADVAVWHVDLLDQAGHGHGWGSPEYLEAIHDVDVILGELLDLQRQGRIANILMTCDHGGFGQIHGTNEKYDRCILFLADPSLEVVTHRTVYQYDMAPSVLHLLGLSIPSGTDGKVAVRLKKHAQRRKKHLDMPRRSPRRINYAAVCSAINGDHETAELCRALRQASLNAAAKCKGGRCPSRSPRAHRKKKKKAPKKKRSGSSSPRSPRKKKKAGAAKKKKTKARKSPRRNSKGQFVKRK